MIKKKLNKKIISSMPMRVYPCLSKDEQPPFHQKSKKPIKVVLYGQGKKQKKW